MRCGLYEPCHKERLGGISEYERAKGFYIIGADFIEGLPKKLTILHLLPKSGEISPRMGWVSWDWLFQTGQEWNLC
jgi:hypothetical protein